MLLTALPCCSIPTLSYGSGVFQHHVIEAETHNVLVGLSCNVQVFHLILKDFTVVLR